MRLNGLEGGVGNHANPEVTVKIEFLTDSGAIYSVVPTPILDSLGIKPLTIQEFRLADERYRLGSGTSLELREAQVNLTQAEQILVSAEYNAIITYIEL